MISIRSSYHPIDAAILWCGLAAYQDEILRVDASQPGCLRKHFPQWPSLQRHLECICDAIICGELPATYLGRPITSDHQVHHEYCSVRRADLVAWFLRNFPDQRPAFLFPPNLDHSECISLNAHLVQEAEIDASQRTIEKLRQELAATTEEMATLVSANRELSERLEACGIPSETSECMHNTLVGAVLEVTLGKSNSGQVQSIYPSQAALVEEITRRFPGVSGLSKSTLDRRFAEARRHFAQAFRA
ncbi:MULTISPECIES: hypothetical protein [Pseudomonas]|jgi:hypothetical protein|uniref:Uncharacterized protein n=1 Tax=Pseudomonas urmiensis TaxID=2745493 RepID=A0A923G099_9PSED|nr:MULTISPECIES: hypothetical protein [Pseudomonas]MBV4535634.1 hypothetical protein [Pseudomonas urmiensis]MDD2146731.1 hypothetical protein [Pseudomonas putida]UVL87103.1 hypothetical protein LOY51_14965 [Pseudomonas sichuanensis]WNN39170.1 hypothetical protein RIN61_23735 [Pseudomonas inefficax]HDS1705620.1 hypothetical protein [Pseudomonas putida]